MKVNYICPFTRKNGVARAAHDYCMALLASGVDLTIYPMFKCDTDDLDVDHKVLARHASKSDPRPDPNAIWILHAMPGDLAEFVDLIPDCKERICVTTWETSQLPREYAELLDERFGLVILPSYFSQGALREAEVMVETCVVPHAIAPRWTDAKRNWNDDPHMLYQFYTIGAWGERKNILGLLKAYYTEFTADDRVVLWVKTDMVDEQTVEALKLGTGLQRLPAVRFHTDWMSEEQLLELHQDSDCYVTATRGEGFGLGAFEACALGNPVISPEKGGQATFLDSSVSAWGPVPCQRTPAVWTECIATRTIAAGAQLIRLQGITSIAPKGVDGTQYWFEPDLEAMQVHMRTMYEARLGCDPQDDIYGETHVEQARKRFKETFSYEAIGRRFRRVLEQL